MPGRRASGYCRFKDAGEIVNLSCFLQVIVLSGYLLMQYSTGRDQHDQCAGLLTQAVWRSVCSLPHSCILKNRLGLIHQVQFRREESLFYCMSPDLQPFSSTNSLLKAMV